MQNSGNAFDQFQKVNIEQELRDARDAESRAKNEIAQLEKQLFAANSALDSARDELKDAW
jgi:hypothetical protein